MTTTTAAPNADLEVEQATLGAVLLLGDARVCSSLAARGLRPTHFYWEKHRNVFTAALALADRQSGVDTVTILGELDRLGLRANISRGDVDELAAMVPSTGNYADYADRVIELARWRERQIALHKMNAAVTRRDGTAWASARADLDSATAGTRTESFSGEAWGHLMWDHFEGVGDASTDHAIATPFPRLTRALGLGLEPGEWLALSGPTSHGKTAVADHWLDHAALEQKRSCHVYMTEMTAVTRGMRYLARRTGVPFMRQRRRDLTDGDRQKLIAEMSNMPYGCTVAADWNVDDIVRDALRARYDFIVVDLLHGFHYEDERALDRLSKAMTKLARASTTIDGHHGTAVVAVTHLKEEGMRDGKIPRPTISSIKGGSSIKQDADFVMFVWQDQEKGTGAPTGKGEIWLAKGRNGELANQDVEMNNRRIRFEAGAEELVGMSSGAF